MKLTVPCSIPLFTAETGGKERGVVTVKRVLGAILAVSMMLTLCACGQKATTWEEQYDLGVRYLSDGNYEEAIIAFTAAIEIDPKRAEAFLGRGDAYEELGDLERAAADYQAALELGPNADAETKLRKWEAELLAAQLQDELWPMVCDLVLPMTVDSVVLGETSIETAKSIYASYPYAKSNLMNDDTQDTVYNCFGMDMPVPAGYEENEFGFLFAAPVGGAVCDIVINQPGFITLGALQVGDVSETALSLFGFPETPPPVSLRWILDNGSQLDYTWHGDDNFMFIYRLNGQEARAYVEAGIVHSMALTVEGTLA